MTGTIHEDQRTFLIISRSVLHNQSTNFMFNNFFFFRKSCHLSGNVEKY